MSPRRGLDLRHAWLSLATAALLVVCCPPAVHAQQAVADQYQDRQLAYDAARSQYQAALNAWRVYEKQWNDAIEEHERARRGGDAGRENAALTRALDLSRELDIADRRVKDQKKALDGSKGALLTALDARAQLLTDQVASARTPADKARFGALLRDIDNQQKELEADQGDQPAVQLVFYPSIQYDPRDTPETLAGKAQLLRAKAVVADSSVALIDRQIRTLEGRLKIRRNMQSVVQGLERFGDIQAPGTSSPRNPQGDVPAQADSSGVARPQLSPETQIQNLRLLRLQVLTAKRQFLERAGKFEDMVRRIG